MASVELSVPLRKPFLGLYVWLFNCRMEEAMTESLQEYHSLMELFKRMLKSGVRPIETSQELVCRIAMQLAACPAIPADCRVS